MRPIKLTFFLLAMIALAWVCGCAQKGGQTIQYGNQLERVVEVTPTPRPSATPGPFDLPVDPVGRPKSADPTHH